jgi:hypothetical protein
MRLSQPFTGRLSKYFVFNTCFQSEGYVKGKPYYPLYAKKEPMPLYTYRAYIGKPFKTCTLHFFSRPLRRLVIRPPGAFQFPRGETA